MSEAGKRLIAAANQALQAVRNEAPERMWIADHGPEGAPWRKAFPNRPEFYGRHYKAWVPADLQAAQIAELVGALRDAERFLNYFATGELSFNGPGTPKQCLAHVSAMIAKYGDKT